MHATLMYEVPNKQRNYAWIQTEILAETYCTIMFHGLMAALSTLCTRAKVPRA